MAHLILNICRFNSQNNVEQNIDFLWISYGRSQVRFSQVLHKYCPNIRSAYFVGAGSLRADAGGKIAFPLHEAVRSGAEKNNKKWQVLPL